MNTLGEGCKFENRDVFFKIDLRQRIYFILVATSKAKLKGAKRLFKVIEEVSRWPLAYQL